jgi:hypothetical protein
MAEKKIKLSELIQLRKIYNIARQREIFGVLSSSELDEYERITSRIHELEVELQMRPEKAVA